jgi:hypothetical protein
MVPGDSFLWLRERKTRIRKRERERGAEREEKYDERNTPNLLSAKQVCVYETTF